MSSREWVSSVPKRQVDAQLHWSPACIVINIEAHAQMHTIPGPRLLFFALPNFCPCTGIAVSRYLPLAELRGKAGDAR